MCRTRLFFCLFKLEDIQNKGTIHSYLCKTFHLKHEDFKEKLNADPYLICCKNGVYDLSKMEFRDGKPEDCISISMKIDYIPKPSKYMEDLQLFLKSILPNNADRDYVLKFLGICLTGRNPERKSLIWSGDSSNGKSVFMQLVKITFGEYYHTFSSALLSDTRPASKDATPDLVCFKYKRICIGSEPDANKPINSAFFKQMTGNDDVNARGLHKDQDTLEQTWKICTLCNTIPKFDADEQAIWNRLRCVEFPNKFVDVPDPKKKNEYKTDAKILEKLTLYKSDFLLLLIEKYQLYLREGLQDTKNILAFTRKYRESGNYVLEFARANLVESKTKHSFFSNLYAQYKFWFKRSYPGEPLMNERKFTDALKKIYPDNPYGTVREGKTTARGIKFLVLKSPDETNDSDDGDKNDDSD